MKIGISTCGNKLADERFFEKCAEAGVDCVEITLHRDLYADFDFAATVCKARENGIEVWSCHLPFSPFATNDISSNDEEKRCNTIAMQKGIIDRAGAAGIKRFIIHPSAEPIEILDRHPRLLQAKRSLSELADEAEKFGAVICVEDLPRTCLGRSSYDICELTKDDERLRVCFDTNHLLGEYIPDFVRKIGKKIVTLHVSDYDFINERHWLPGEGQIDWQELYSLLTDIGYEGPWLYEVSFGSEAKGFIRERELTLPDFVRNANEIFNNNPLTIITHVAETEL